jgi:hypothetical protein
MNSRNYFLVAAFASFVFSVALWFSPDGSMGGGMGGGTEIHRQQALFVGLWVPSILSLGNLLK